jgi:hypothetical protein
MARRPTQQEAFDALLSQYETEIAAAMLAAFANIRDSADAQAIAAAIERGDTEEALAALHLDPAAFASFNQTERNAFIAAGIAAITILPALRSAFGTRVVVRFNPAQYGIENALQARQAATVARILDDQRDAVRMLIRNGLANNINPRNLALEIVGRINRATGKREGGLIGLTAAQSEFASNARIELESGNPALLRNYLTRTLRDARYDASVRRFLTDGTPIPRTIVDGAVQSYRNRLLLQRGRTAGTTEAQFMLHAGQEAAFDQVIASGGLGNTGRVIGTWRQNSVPPNARHTHKIMNGQKRLHGVPFESPTGARMLHPGDMSLGAGLDDIVSCKCSVIKRIVWNVATDRLAA